MAPSTISPSAKSTITTQAGNNDPAVKEEKKEEKNNIKICKQLCSNNLFLMNSKKNKREKKR